MIEEKINDLKIKGQTNSRDVAMQHLYKIKINTKIDMQINI
jgi:hypothetical protein